MSTAVPPTRPRKSRWAPARRPDDVILAPQSGPQTRALASTADILVFGGGAGGGKTWGLLAESARHALVNPDFGAVLFRRTYPEITNEGGLWDASEKLYRQLGARGAESKLLWQFRRGGRVQFRHLQHEKSIYDYQGTQIPLLGFDELTHFSAKQFFYLLSRNRSTCGVRPYVRATCNPDPDSWVREFLDWWIDPATGLAIPGRAGVVRWFIRVNDAMVWADAPQILIARYEKPGAREEERVRPKSATFIPASVYDNRILLRENPDYLANLQALPLVERERLLGQNWNIRPTAGKVFNRTDLVVVRPEQLPFRFLAKYRAWDKAATEGDGDWTVGVLLGLGIDRLIYVLDVVRGQWGTATRERKIRETAERDGRVVPIAIEHEPGAGGVDSAKLTLATLEGFTAHAELSRGDKLERAEPFSAAVQNGRVRVLLGDWNKPYIDILHAFPDGAHDDDVDASALAYRKLSDRARIADPNAYTTVRG